MDQGSRGNRRFPLGVHPNLPHVVAGKKGGRDPEAHAPLLPPAMAEGKKGVGAPQGPNLPGNFPGNGGNPEGILQPHVCAMQACEGGLPQGFSLGGGNHQADRSDRPAPEQTSTTSPRMITIHSAAGRKHSIRHSTFLF